MPAADSESQTVATTTARQVHRIGDDPLSLFGIQGSLGRSIDGDKTLFSHPPTIQMGTIGGHFGLIAEEPPFATHRWLQPQRR